jgi:hypothetical protein
MNDITQTLLRSICKAAAGWAMSKGFLDHDSGEGIVGAVMLIISVAWGIAHHKSYGTPSNQPGGKPPLLSLFLCGFLALTMMPGCSTQPETVAYRAAGSTEITVDHAMRAWGDYVAKNHPSVGQETMVQVAFNRYGLAMNMAITAAEDYAALSKTNSTAAPLAKTRAETASALASQNLSDLVALLGSFGVKF